MVEICTTLSSDFQSRTKLNLLLNFFIFDTMTRIKGYGYTRKDKVFAEFEGESGTYFFKESHSSHKGVYDIGIYNPEGKKIFKLKMSREQMNKLKSGESIANIDFFF